MVMLADLSRRTLLKGSMAIAAGTVVPSTASAQDLKIIRVHATKDMANIDPSERIDVNDERIMAMIYSSLVRQKEGLEWGWELDIAESIEAVDPTHVRFTLRPGVLWTNGFGEVTTEDVKYSYERIGKPENESAYKIDWELLDHVEIIDKYTGVIVMKQPSAPLWTTSLPGRSGCIVCKAAIEGAGGGKFSTDPIATSGPYKIKDWQPNQKLVLDRNPGWNGEAYEFDEFHLVPVTDEKAAEVAFEAGELDLAFISISSIPLVKENIPAGAKLNVQPSLNYRWVGMNAEHPKLQDIRVRRAIQQAINVEEYLLAAYNGAAERSFGIVPPGMVGHRDYNLMKYDPAASKALLAEAGVGGIELTLNIINKADDLAGAQVVQSNLAEVGIKVEIIPNDSGVYYTLGLESEGEMWKDVQLTIQRFGIGSDPSWGTAWFVCEQVGVWNWQRVCSTEFDELHQKAMTELDPAVRYPMYIRMQDIMEESGAYVFTTHGPNAYLYSDRIVPSPDPDGRYQYRLKHFKLA
ncbi:MAG: ABC transporter substrate-binding protein [Alphaproteobacteria bacterium]